MKNIHLIPTEKPSNLYIGDNGSFVFGMIKTSTQSRNDDFTNQHIYITSDEEIGEGDWFKRNNPNLTSQQNDKIYKCSFLHKDGTIQPITNHLSMSKWKQEFCKKIILTTDPDLIAGGVQSIDDEFLEWFVKNPTCEFVQSSDSSKDGFYNSLFIPQEEPKKYPIGGYAPGNYTCNCVTCKKQFIGDKRAVQCEPCATEMVNTKIVENNGGYQIEEPNEETLEEASWRYNPVKKLDAEFIRQAFKEGASWQAERMYSDEEVLKAQQAILNNIRHALDNDNYIIEYLEQFKKK